MNQALLLAHAADRGALAVASALALQLGRNSIHLVRPEALALSDWTQRIDCHGRVQTRLVLPGGNQIDSAALGVVFNRIRWMPMPRFRRANPRDLDYAGAEMQAIVASWLASLGRRVVHPVRPHPWIPPSIPLQHWAAASAKCGLPVGVRTIANSPRYLGTCKGKDSPGALHPTTPSGPTDALLVAGSIVEGALKEEFGERCLAVACAMGFPLLEFRFSRSNKEITLVDVEPMPSLGEPWAVRNTARLLASIFQGGAG